MPYEVFLALRYLRSRRKHRLARATTLIAVLGIAAGVASLIVALALADGFRDEMRDKILRGTAHITVMRSDGQPLGNYRQVAAEIANVAGVSAAAGTTYDGAVIVGPKSSAYGVLRGIDQSSSQMTNEISATIVRGSLDPVLKRHGDARPLPAVVLGAELATRLGVDVGDTADVISTQPSFSSANSNRRRVRVAGISRSGLFEYDSTWIYVSFETITAFTGDAHAASVVSVQVADIYNVKRTAAQIRQLLGSSYEVIDWQEANRPLFTALTLERRIGIMIIALIVLIAALNITTTLILLVMERRRDIAILNAMGATPNGIMTIFVIEGAILGLCGAVAGVLLGAIATLVANSYHLISLPPDVYSISSVPLHLKSYNIIFAALIAFVLSILATIYPARAASRIHAAELLRSS
ncbi:MAG TPA: ABC transporter permease [Pyrinomonadaceae bacterium]|nr:ABC transporter permease [Pyrinomonadaceae bacterium]